MRELAHLFSKIFHPVFSPIWLFLIVSIGVQAFVLYSLVQMVYIFSIVSFLAVGMPILVILFLKWVGLISHLELNNRTERILPLVVGALFVWGASSFLHRINFPITMIMLLRLSVIVLVIATFITMFWKISLHALGWGVVSSVAFMMVGLTGSGYFFIFPITLFIAGLVATSRLYLGAHSPTQIYCGFGLGFIGLFTGVYFQAFWINFII